MDILLQACLVAIYEVKSSSTEFQRLPDLTQPSVHHSPAVMRTGKVNPKSVYAPSTAGCCPILPSVACVPWSRVGYWPFYMCTYMCKLRLPKLVLVQGVALWSDDHVLAYTRKCLLQAWTHRSPERESSLSIALPTHSILPAGIAALFGSPASVCLGTCHVTAMSLQNVATHSHNNAMLVT